MRADQRRPKFLKRALRAALPGAILALAPLSAAGAADLPPGLYPEQQYLPPIYTICALPTGPVILFDRYGRPTVPARTPMFYCLTGHTLTPGEIPPPPEYCCR